MAHLLIGGLGKGGGSPCAAGSCGTSYAVGGGYFALDVTTPTSNTETNRGQLGAWEINQSSSGFAHLGYSYETPLMIKTKKYGWTLVLTSGYGNDNGQGYFYLVNPKTGTLYESIATGAGSTTVLPVSRMSPRTSTTSPISRPTHCTRATCSAMSGAWI